jgi:hypothetical protein
MSASAVMESVRALPDSQLDVTRERQAQEAALQQYSQAVQAYSQVGGGARVWVLGFKKPI